MYDLIDIYIKKNGKWLYVDGTRMHKTLASAKKNASEFYGVECKAKFANLALS